MGGRWTFWVMWNAAVCSTRQQAASICFPQTTLLSALLFESHFYNNSVKKKKSKPFVFCRFSPVFPRRFWVKFVFNLAKNYLCKTEIRPLSKEKSNVEVASVLLSVNLKNSLSTVDLILLKNQWKNLQSNTYDCSFSCSSRRYFDDLSL